MKNYKTLLLIIIAATVIMATCKKVNTLQDEIAVTLTDSNYVNAISWHYIYAGVHSAKIYGANTLPAPENNCTVFKNEGIVNTGTNPVKVFAVNYVKPDAVNNNLFVLSCNPKTYTHTNHIDFCHCIRNRIFTITTLPPKIF